MQPGYRARASKVGADELAGQRGGSGDPQRSQRGHPGSGWWTEGPVGSFAQRKDQKQGLTCKEIPWAAFLALWTRGSCRGREGAEGQGQRLGDRSAPGGRGRQGAEGSWCAGTGEREEKRGTHSASLRFLGHWKNSLTEDRKNRFGGQVRRAREEWVGCR